MRKTLIEIDGKQYILESDDLQLFDNWLLKDLLCVAEEQRLTKRAADSLKAGGKSAKRKVVKAKVIRPAKSG